MDSTGGQKWHEYNSSDRQALMRREKGREEKDFEQEEKQKTKRVGRESRDDHSVGAIGARHLHR